MSMAICFWILMLISIVFGFWSNGVANYKQFGPSLLVFLLLALLGWHVFGAPLHS